MVILRVDVGIDPYTTAEQPTCRGGCPQPPATKITITVQKREKENKCLTTLSSYDIIYRLHSRLYILMKGETYANL